MLVVAMILQYLRCLVSMPCSQPVEKRRLWEGLTEAFQHLKGAEKKHREKFFSRACSDRTKGNNLEMKESRFKRETRKKLLQLWW